ncbi:IPT/TIG domain-containing protein [Candidatus Kaiserbacteria bacterium]|nr:IPT/TIG domain-containing protein [Candidatus Kaiserbacteria bacterium]
MNKILASSLVAVVALGANIASAQSYYSPYVMPSQPSTYSSGACVNLVSDLSYGSTGSQVRQLQTFLVSRNYPGGGSWMITGNFRTATLTAVRNFQMEQNLPTTGVADAATRAAIAQVSCGGSAYNYNTNPYLYSLPNYNNNYNNNFNYNNLNCYYTYPYTCNNSYNYNPYNYNNYNPYNYNYNYGVSLSSISPVSGERGTTITVYGTNLDYFNNTVYFGSQPVANVPSQNGTSLTVTIPWGVNPGGVGVYVTNSRGTSNTLTFNVIASYSGCNYPSPFAQGYGGTQYTYGSYNTTYCPPNMNAPYITNLSPNSGAVGTIVTVNGSGFSPTGNTVHFGGGVITGISSSNGNTLTFTVPSQLTGPSSQFVTVGTYNVSVSNFAGFTSNSVPFSVTSTGSYGAPTITSVNGPTSLSTGTVGTWTITVNNQNNTYMTTSVRWGDEGTYPNYASSPQTSYSGTNTLTFTHTYNTPGTYNVVFTVSNNQGQQNTASATVLVGSGTYGNVTLSYLSPTVGRVGTQVMLQGSGFSAFDNTVHFGIGGTQHVPSYNGTTIYYTIPYSVSPCDVVTYGTFCAQATQMVTPGSYPVYVTNSGGTSQTLNFTVTN